LLAVALMMAACAAVPPIPSATPQPSLPAPTVTCDLPADVCRQAIDLARDLSPEPWSAVGTALVHLGTCVFNMSCPMQRDSADWISVEMYMKDSERDAFITIDRRSDSWSATCSLWIPRSNGASTEACPAR
jgi:hypothetical protein